MEIKTIEQIKEEYASERGYTSWRNLTWDSDVVSINKDVDVIALRYAINYATQLQPNIDLITTEICVLRDKVAELEGDAINIKKNIETRISELNAADSEFCKKRWDMSLPEGWRNLYREESNSVTFARQVLEEQLKLINKGKDNGI